MDPEILVVDEVLAVGDAAFQKKCLGKMGEVARGGRTVLFVSHNMNAVEELCQKVVVLQSGRLQRMGEDVRALTCEYLFNGDVNDQSSQWTNNAGRLDNQWFKPLRFLIADRHGEPVAMPVRNDAELWVQVQGEVDCLDPAMNLGYALFDASGQLLYWSLTTDTDEANWPVIRRGSLAVRSRIPLRFLNEGDYQLELIAALHFREWICQPGLNAPSVRLSIKGGLSDSPYWMVSRPGMLAPILPWTACGPTCCGEQAPERSL